MLNGFRIIFLFIASGLRDSESQELFCRGQHTSVSFNLNTSLNAQQFAIWVSLLQRHISLLQENKKRISFSSRF